jgi:hypothetical protein
MTLENIRYMLDNKNINFSDLDEDLYTELLNCPISKKLEDWREEQKQKAKTTINNKEEDEEDIF